jgi:hypothetical protein
MWHMHDMPNVCRQAGNKQLLRVATRQPVMNGVSSEISVQIDPGGSGFIEVNSQGSARVTL